TIARPPAATTGRRATTTATLAAAAAPGITTTIDAERPGTWSLRRPAVGWRHERERGQRSGGRRLRRPPALRRLALRGRAPGRCGRALRGGHLRGSAGGRAARLRERPAPGLVPGGLPAEHHHAGVRERRQDSHR